MENVFNEHIWLTLARNSKKFTWVGLLIN